VVKLKTGQEVTLTHYMTYDEEFESGKYKIQDTKEPTILTINNPLFKSGI